MSSVASNPIRSIISAAPAVLPAPVANIVPPVANSVDLSVMAEGRRPPPELPLEVLGPKWGLWVQNAAECCAAPKDYVFAALLAAAATTIGNSRWSKPWDGWQEPPVIWIGLIGGPSTGKSPGMDAVIDALRTLEQEDAAGYPDLLRDWQTKLEAAKCAKAAWQSQVKDAVANGNPAPAIPESAVEPEKPPRPRLVFSDATQEEIGSLMAAMPKGLLSYRDELAGWFLNFDRYGGGGDRAFWLEAWGGRSYVIDRKKNEGTPHRIHHNSISVLGGIQPDRLSSGLFNGDDDGLAARLLCVWPDPVPAARPRMAFDPQLPVIALRRLRQLGMATTEHGTPTYVAVPFTEEAAAVLDGWRTENFKTVQEASGRYASHLGKYPGMLIRLALVLEFLWWSVENGPEPKEITGKAVTAAALLIEEYFKPMAERAYGDASVPENERHAASIAKWIAANKPEAVNPRDLRHKKGLPGLRDTDQVKAAFDVLIEAGWLEAPEPGKGHRGRNDYVVRPAVYRALA
jgi:putative DNA primase/helicase